MSLRGGRSPTKQSPIKRKKLLDEICPLNGRLLRAVALAMIYVTLNFQETVPLPHTPPSDNISVNYHQLQF